jgi:small subunit ribosomal protein S27Ae
MQIFLHNLDGSQSVLNISGETTLETILTGSFGTRLVYQGAILKSLDSLCDNANVYVTGDLDGGKKKKKKKAFTTKKKNKHIHKKIKLLPLSLYAVDGKFLIM